MFDEIEDVEKTNSARVYDKIKEFGSKKGVSSSNIIKDKDFCNMIIHSSNLRNVNNRLCKHSPELSLSQLLNMLTPSRFYR